MALRKVIRRRAPLDGQWFRTKASLQSIMRAASRYDDDCIWPKFVEDGQDGAAFVARRADRGPAQRGATRSVGWHIAEVGAPRTERARR